MRTNNIKVISYDRVKIEMTIHDVTKGRITLGTNNVYICKN